MKKLIELKTEEKKPYNDSELREFFEEKILAKTESIGIISPNENMLEYFEEEGVDISKTLIIADKSNIEEIKSIIESNLKGEGTIVKYNASYTGQSDGILANIFEANFKSKEYYLYAGFYLDYPSLITSKRKEIKKL